MKTTLLHTFSFGDTTGSPQYIHVFESEEERYKAFLRFKVEDEFDHSFITIEKDCVQASWKNKAGAIQFCGSGAYAIAWLLLSDQSRKSISIEADFLKLNAYREKNQILLSIPASLPRLLSKTEEYQLYYSVKSGVYFFALNNLDSLESADWRVFHSYIKDRDVHGLCLFAWDDKRKGHIRYFTPWHGREEDYVTGSIHEYLTPLIYKLYRAKNQNWTQLSKLEGRLNSSYSKDKVILWGSCYLSR